MFSFFKRKKGKKKFRFSLGKRLKELFSKKDTFPYEEIEKLFYEADLGVELSVSLTEKLQSLFKKNPNTPIEEIIDAAKEELLERLKKIEIPKEDFAKIPHVILIVGVNGSGKTTSLAKLANYYKLQNKKVLIAAADTFRAAAIEQLDTWAQSIGIDIVRAKHNSDPSAIVFDALEAAKARNIDIVLIDTAGRLHTKTDLMQELEKIKRVCHKKVENAPHETFLVLDATTGQNAIDQAKIFHQFTPISGIILTKLDGTAKGGIAISIQKELNVPVLWVATGETIEDLEPFDAKQFIDDLLASN